jgi:putative transposase
MIFFGEPLLRNAMAAHLDHYHSERNYQGPKNKMIQREAAVGNSTGVIQCRERLGGPLRYYHRKAA